MRKFSTQPEQETNDKWQKYSFKTKPVCHRYGRRGHIRHYCKCNQANEGLHRERQVLNCATQPTYCQSERTSTNEEENQSDTKETALQLESQEATTNSPNLSQRTKATRTNDQSNVTPRKPNQKPRKVRMSNQLRHVQFRLVNEVDKYPSNLTTTGKICLFNGGHWWTRFSYKTSSGGDLRWSSLFRGSDCEWQPTTKKNYLAATPIGKSVPSYRTLLMMSFLVAISSNATEPLVTSITTLLLLQKQKIHRTKKVQPQCLQWDRLHLEKRMLKQENTPLPVKVLWSHLKEICLPVIRRTRKLRSSHSLIYFSLLGPCPQHFTPT